MDPEKTYKTQDKLFCGRRSYFLEALVFKTVLSKIYHQKKFILQVETNSSFPRWILFWVVNSNE